MLRLDRKKLLIGGVAAASVSLGGCAFDMGGFAFMDGKSATAHVGTTDPVLGPDGRCEADASISPAALGPQPREVTLGMTECQLVAMKGQPTDVLIGESGKGQREVQVLYQEPAGKHLYMFTDNRLAKVVD